MENSKVKYIWPEIFVTGKAPYNYDKKKAVADGLQGWALASFDKAPEKFGEGMVIIGQLCGGAAPEYLTKEANKILQNK